MFTEEREACLHILNMNPQKGDKLSIRLYDGETLEGHFVRFIYKGFVIKNKGVYSRLKCLDVEWLYIIERTSTKKVNKLTTV